MGRSALAEGLDKGDSLDGGSVIGLVVVDLLHRVSSGFPSGVMTAPLTMATESRMWKN